jgi:hypothetical protein
MTCSSTNATIGARASATSLNPFTDKHIQEYVFDRRGITGYELSFFVDASGGVPGLLALMADNVARKYQDDDDDFFSDI